MVVVHFVLFTVISVQNFLYKIFLNQFTGTHVHVCDFYREKAWNEWVSKGTNGVSENRAEVLLYLRNIAKSANEDALKENIRTLKESHVWRQSIQLQKYFTEFWGLHLQVLQNFKPWPVSVADNKQQTYRRIDSLPLSPR